MYGGPPKEENLESVGFSRINIKAMNRGGLLVGEEDLSQRVTLHCQILVGAPRRRHVAHRSRVFHPKSVGDLLVADSGSPASYAFRSPALGRDGERVAVAIKLEKLNGSGHGLWCSRYLLRAFLRA